jgi:hypothetical protein
MHRSFSFFLLDSQIVESADALPQAPQLRAEYTINPCEFGSDKGARV